MPQKATAAANTQSRHLPAAARSFDGKIKRKAFPRHKVVSLAADSAPLRNSDRAFLGKITTFLAAIDCHVETGSRPTKEGCRNESRRKILRLLYPESANNK
jgi:hypothetical protein